jgi:hypothetical protein
MSWDEKRTRARQVLSQRWDAAVYYAGIRRRGDRPRLNVSPEPSFFFRSAEIPQLAALLSQRLPTVAEEIVQQADRICRHRFDLLGYEDLDFGQVIDWRLDPVHGKQAPRRPGHRVHYLDFTEVGDHKIIWELNRHQHLVTLAKAFHLTGEDRYVRELAAQWDHWQQSNPYPMGINWASSLEVAFRSLAWLWVLHLLSGCPALPKDRLLRALALQARHIQRYLSTYFSPNTHLLGEAVALFFIGTLCPQFPRAGRWQALGQEIILQEIQRQVQSDGMHFEQSVYYHVYALDLFLHARCLAAANGITFPAEFDLKLEQMLQVLTGISPAGLTPRFGDDDGGRVFNPRRNGAQHLLDPLTLGAALFQRADLKSACRGLTEETVWLLGASGLARFDQLPPGPPAAESTRYEPSGIAVMADCSSLGRQLLIKAGPLGHGAAGHGHADALSVQVVLNGQEFLSDSGTFCYVPSAPRDRYRGTAAHNTLCLDGLDQAPAKGPFSWRSTPQVQTHRWVAGRTFDLFEGSHTGYTRLTFPAVHRRWVLNLKSGFWLVRDRVEGVGQHELDIRWHTAPHVELKYMDDKLTTFAAPNGTVLAMLPAEGHGWSKELARGSVSPVYGREEPSLVLSFRCQATLPTEMALLLIPQAPGPRELRTLTQVSSGNDSAPLRCYAYETPLERVHMVFAEGGRPWEFGPWASDACFFYHRVKPSENEVSWVLCHGSYIREQERPVVIYPHPVERWECIATGSERQVFAAEESPPNPGA